MDGVTAVIVSYRQDLEKFSRCIGSVMMHGNNLQEIIIVVNDEEHSVPLFQQIVRHEPRIRVLHWSQFADWRGVLDWWSQQYFKLAIAVQITTPWYLLLDSDDILIQDLDQATLFDQQHRARCLTEDIELVINSKNPDLMPWLLTAQRMVGNTDTPRQTLGNLTPMMMHTETVRSLMESLKPDCFDVSRSQDLTLEFYLYHAWLEQHGLTESLYSPVKRLSYALDKRGL